MGGDGSGWMKSTPFWLTHPLPRHPPGQTNPQSIHILHPHTPYMPYFPHTPRRTDFKKNNLTTVGAISSWIGSTIADTQMYQKLSSSQDWDQAGLEQQAWVSSLAR